MRSSVFFAILLLTISNVAKACNACGCSAANQSIGLLSQMPSSFIGLQYQVRGFSTIHPDDEGSDLPGISQEYYRTFQLAGKYDLGNRVQLMAFAPYTSNLRMQKNVTTVSMNGIGDATLLANVFIVKKSNCTWKHDLLLGGGLKMPTGVYDRQSTKSDEGLPNMQPGTHSWDAVFTGSYTVSYKEFGFNTDASYTATTANSDKYKFGNRFSTNEYLFYKLKMKSLIILPEAGISYDLIQKDYSNYSAKEIDGDSGSWHLFASIGVQALYKHFGMQMSYQLPVSQHYNSGLVTNWYKSEAGIFLLF